MRVLLILITLKFVKTGCNWAEKGAQL